MKKFVSPLNIGAVLSILVALVSLILFSSAYNGCYGYFAMQDPTLPSVVAYSIIAIVLSALAIGLPLIKVEGVAKKAIDVVVDLLVIAIAVFMILIAVFEAKASIYEMALTWGSELHINEPYMYPVCAKALTSIILAVVGFLVISISSMFSKKEA
ncbi:MAG: hypothetical protein MJ238_03230 [Bacilli bacterium]|nr:hypothetical protein [Bacilli bacterium]